MDLPDAIDLIGGLIRDDDVDVRRCVIHPLGRLYRDCGRPEEIRQLLCDVDVGSDDRVLNDLLRVVDKQYGIDPDALSDQQVKALLDKVSNAKQIDDNDYEIGQFLSFCLVREPKSVIQMLLQRIEESVRSDTSDEEGKQVQPFPHLGFSDPSHRDVVTHAQFGDCVRLMVEAASKDAWQYRFWCPRIFKWLDPSFTQQSQRALSDILRGATESQVVGMTCLLENYEHGIAFVAVDFICGLLASADAIGPVCCKKARSRLLGGVFSGSWCESPPGEPSAHHVGIADACATVLLRTDLPTPARAFYQSAKEHAESLNRQKLETDRIEEEEDTI